MIATSGHFLEAFVFFGSLQYMDNIPRLRKSETTVASNELKQ